jgi:alpha-tubulin suppressor-like RCC1 family protein
MKNLFRSIFKVNLPNCRSSLSRLTLTLLLFGLSSSLMAQYTRREQAGKTPYGRNYQRASAGFGHTVEIRGGELWAWGWNSMGQLGDGSGNDQLSPIQIGTANDWISVAAGSYSTLALKANGTLWAWGDNLYGQLGNGTNTYSPIPIQVGTDNDWISITQGGISCFAIKANGSVYAWGSNSHGQLGIGSTVDSNIPVRVGTANDWVKISSKGNHTLGLKANGTLWAWGGNIVGQVGDGTFTDRTTPVQVGSASNWSNISAGSGFSIALKSNGTLWGWGDNTYGQLGIGSGTGPNTPVRIGADNTWKLIASGNRSNYAIKTNGTLWVWGDNFSGELGNGNNIGVNVPVQSGSSNTWVDIAPGFSHAVGVQVDGVLKTWGRNQYGRLGDGTTVDKNSPVTISTITGWLMATGGSQHTAALKMDGSIWAWGWNNIGELGVASAGVQQSFFAPILSDSSAGYISLHSEKGTGNIGLKADGTLWRFGDTFPGNIHVPVQLENQDDWVFATTGVSSGAGIRSNGTLWTWGRNQYGNLGLGYTSLGFTPLTQVGTDTDWVYVSVGHLHSLALKSDGSLWAWGYNATGTLGNGTYQDSYIPVRVGNANNWVAAMADYHFSSAGIRSDGTLWVWGQNFDGVLGQSNLTLPDSPLPLQVGTDSDWVSFSIGQYALWALKANGTLWGRGSNIYGLLGLPNTSPTGRIVPELVPQSGNIGSFFSGHQHKGVIPVTRSSICFTGSNFWGQFGFPNPRTDHFGLTCSTPVQTPPFYIGISPAYPSPTCEGASLSMSAWNIPGATYLWNGPNGFTSNQRNLSLTNIQMSQAGSYSLTVSYNNQSLQDSVRVIVRPFVGNNTISAAQSVCIGGTLILTGSTPTGGESQITGNYNYLWQTSSDSLNWNYIFGNMQDTLLFYNSANTNAYYRRMVLDPACPSSISNGVFVEAIASPLNTIAANQTVAQSIIPALLTGNAPIGVVSYQWFSTTDSLMMGWSTIAWATNQNFQPSATQVTRWYHRQVTIAGCGSYFGNSIEITIGSSIPVSYLTVNSPLNLCEGSPLYLSVQSSNPLSAVYTWSGPSFNAVGQTVSIANAGTQHSGTYTVTATFTDATTETASINVTVYPVIRRNLITSNSPICAGNTIILSAPVVSGLTYSWSGPNGFASSNAVDSIPNASGLNSGQYILTVSYPVGSCPSQAYTLNVSVNSASSATVSSSNPICVGNALFLYSSLPAGASILWAGPNGFSSNNPSPSISNAQVNRSGIYSATVTLPGCSVSNLTTNVQVNMHPNGAILGRNNPVCSGGTLSITASNLPNATYSWTGPLGFTSTSNPISITPVNSSHRGNYIVVITVPGCGTASKSTNVDVLPAVTVNAGGNTTLCTGAALFLTTNSVAGATYSWSGPLGFVSTAQNPSISSITVQRAGTYSLTVSSACGTSSATVPVTVYPSSSSITVSASQTVCAGNSLTLTGTNVAGATLSWTKPGFPTASGNTLTIPSVNSSHQGTFTYNVVTPNCGTFTRNVNITVMNPGNVTGSVTSPVCFGAPLYMNAGFISGATYQWQAPDGFVSTLQNPSRNTIRFTNAGIYTLTVTLPSCGSTQRTFPVSVILCREGLFTENAEEMGVIQEMGNVNVYPNPFSESIHLIAPDAEILKLEISDAQGRIIHSQTGSGEKVVVENLMHLPSGVYFLLYETSKEKGTRKLFKQ